MTYLWLGWLYKLARSEKKKCLYMPLTLIQLPRLLYGQYLCQIPP